MTMICTNNRDIRSNMLLGLGMPRRLAERVCDGPIGQSGRFTFRAADEAGDAEILLYDFIGYDWWSDSGTTALSFKRNLDSLGDVKRLTVRINSPGGDVWDGMAIYNQLSQFPAETTVVIDGLAASVASVIAMAGDKIQAAEVSQLMIHDAWTIVMGNEQDLREMADVLSKIDGQIADTYAVRSGRPAAEFRELQNKDTYLTAQEALGLGLIDEVIGTRKAKQEPAVAGKRASRRVRNQISLLRSKHAIS